MASSSATPSTMADRLSAPPLRPLTSFFTFSFQGNETHTFSANTLNEAIFGYNRIEGIEPATGLFTVPIVNVTNLGTGWGDGFADGDYIQHSYHWRDVLTHIVGSHSFKAGFEMWRSNDIALFAGAYDQPTFQFNNMIDLIANNPYSESGISYNPVTGADDAGNYGYKETTFGVFAEDTWKVNRKLTVNYGIRYDNFGNPYVALKGTVLANFHLASGSTFAAADCERRDGAAVACFQPRHELDLQPARRRRIRSIRKRQVGGSRRLWALPQRIHVGQCREWLEGSNPPGYIVPTFYNNGSTATPIFGYGTQNTVPFGFPVAGVCRTAARRQRRHRRRAERGGRNDSPNLSAPDALDWSAGLERQLTSNMMASFGYRDRMGTT